MSPWTLRLSATFVLLTSLSLAQSSWTPQDLSEMRHIRDAALASNYGYQELSYLTDSVGPRLTGSPQHQAAVEYVAAEMRKLGLEVTLEKVTVPHWVRRAESGELISYPGQSGSLPQKIVLTALGHSVGTPAAGLSAEVVVVSTLDELQALGQKVQGKIVLFNGKYDDRLRDAGYSFVAYGQAVRYRDKKPKKTTKKKTTTAHKRTDESADYR